MQVKKEMKVMATARRAGRPARFNLDGIKLAKEVVAQYGLRKGQVELEKRGVKVSLPPSQSMFTAGRAARLSSCVVVVLAWQRNVYEEGGSNNCPLFFANYLPEDTTMFLVIKTCNPKDKNYGIVAKTFDS